MRSAIEYVKQHYLILIVIALTIYFLKPALQGQMGLFRYLQVRAEIEVANEELATLTAERKRLENLTHRLSNQYLDLDLLDEQARERLGLARENEIIIR